MEAAPLLVAATLAAGTPLLLAALGIVVVERSGVVNLGIEGMMLVAAIVAFAVTHATHSYALGFTAGALAGALLAAAFAFFAIGLHTNQYATGLALALFGAGLSAFIGLPYSGESLPARTPDGIAGLREWPVLGAMLFSHHALVYASWPRSIRSARAKRASRG
jgi:simple sugar transport system permease protein